jgi:hypothetical protein
VKPCLRCDRCIDGQDCSQPLAVHAERPDCPACDAPEDRAEKVCAKCMAARFKDEQRKKRKLSDMLSAMHKRTDLEALKAMLDRARIKYTTRQEGMATKMSIDEGGRRWVEALFDSTGMLHSMEGESW